METGSLVNLVGGGPNQPEPKVGDGCTITRWTDRSAGTVVKVTRCTITVKEDSAKRTDKNGLSENQEYVYAYDPDCRAYTFRKTKRGWRCPEGYGLIIGVRMAYWDPHF